MRPIKFRGKSLLTERWLYGSLINNAFFKADTGEPVPCILDTDKMEYDCYEDIAEQIDEYEVYLESVGQYTGLTDKNGKEIYEGDAVDFDGIYEVKYGTHGIPDIETEQYVDEANGFYLKPQHDLKHIEPFNMDVPLNPNYAKQVKVIGSVYENPELLEGDSQ